MAKAIKKEGSASPIWGRSSLTEPQAPDPNTLWGLQGAETAHLQQLCARNTPEVLETGVSVASHLLQQLQLALSTFKSPDIDVWLKSIIELKERSEHPRTVIGIVGSTGAGKSSIINALLDEERLVPTNCLRACTASPTEISYNDSDDPREFYQAEIEFISEKDWIQELEVLFHDLLDGNGQISHEVNNTNSDAGIAYAKVKALYPQMAKEMIAQSSPEGLANVPAVRDILGSTKIIKRESATDLYRQIQRYVDSGEKATGFVEHDRDAPMEYWPLIKVVRVRIKASVLSTGAVIVDLPGVQDSNAARAAVANNYMKSCTGLWIVTPINRAVDDKVAKSLLGDSFKRQLKYDGAFTGLSFICSKTDDISVTETTETLKIKGISEKWDAVKNRKRTEASLKSRVGNIKESTKEMGDQLRGCMAEIKLWKDLRTQISSDKPVYAPPANPRKRKRDGKHFESSRNPDSDGKYDRDSVNAGPSDYENPEPEQNRQPLTEEDIKNNISSLKSQRKNMIKEKSKLDLEFVRLSHEMKQVQDARKSIEAEIRAICIKERNKYAKGAIKHDFAKGIKELDQESAAEDDPNFDPDAEVRDYEALARDFPVFCVCSRAYQKLRGRLEKDNVKTGGFVSVEDTEVPELQKHVKKLTEARRAAHSRSILNELFQLVNSMKLWSADDVVRPSLTDDERRKEEEHLNELLKNLKEGTEASVQQLVETMRTSISRISENMYAFIPEAIEDAPITAASWGAPRADGGLAWSTYKAVVRRKGVFHGSTGLRDFNQDLFNPIWRNLATVWERAFQHHLPAALKIFARDTAKELENFHLAAKARAESRQLNSPNVVILSNQILAHIQAVKALPTTIQDKITELQRDANRHFTQVIRTLMHDAYIICRDERGPGSYARMKTAMVEHVNTARHNMFLDSTEAVRLLLNAIRNSEKQHISKSINSILDTMSKDYMRTFGAEKAASREELNTRAIVREVLLSSDEMFDPALIEAPLESVNERLEEITWDTQRVMRSFAMPETNGDGDIDMPDIEPMIETDEQSGDEETDDEQSEDEQIDDEQTDDEQTDDGQTDDEQTDDEQSEDEPTDDEPADDEQSDVEQTDEQSDEDDSDDEPILKRQAK